MDNQPVADKGRAHGRIRQMIGGYQLGQLQPNPWIKAGLLKQLLRPVVEIIARIQQDKFQIAEGIQCHAGTIRLHVTLIHNVMGIQAPVHQPGVYFEGFGHRQQNVILKGSQYFRVLLHPVAINKNPSDRYGAIHTRLRGILLYFILIFNRKL